MGDNNEILHLDYIYSRSIEVYLSKSAMNRLNPIIEYILKWSNYSANECAGRVELKLTYTLNLKCITSPSFTTYSFPSILKRPFSRQAASD